MNQKGRERDGPKKDTLLSKRMAGDRSVSFMTVRMGSITILTASRTVSVKSGMAFGVSQKNITMCKKKKEKTGLSLLDGVPYPATNYPRNKVLSDSLQKLSFATGNNNHGRGFRLQARQPP
ncbi:hypothetical protein CEXT_730121 [Caerostris extrusa]|uniref:Uncharacterized protein n=1 Tax=Caerostris extrusa TaxID=172846 RepID=A0AAV4N6R4_CAEEX|nr:hypothetical protein CEXT_730121 [Caerostris extrusa]